MTIINTEHAPGAIGPYSQAYETNGLVITSGQLPVNPADGAMPEGIAAQAEWSCRNVGAILEAAGSGFDKVVKTTCFLADIADFAAFNEVYAKYFTSKPARSCVAVKALPKGALGAIEAIAVKSGGDKMKVSVIGSHLCPDTLYALNKLVEAKADITFQNLSASLPDLKAYLALRESSPVFEGPKAKGSLGIPCFVREDGTVTLELEQVLN